MIETELHTPGKPPTRVIPRSNDGWAIIQAGNVVILTADEITALMQHVSSQGATSATTPAKARLERHISNSRDQKPLRRHP